MQRVGEMNGIKEEQRQSSILRATSVSIVRSGSLSNNEGTKQSGHYTMSNSE